jgi:anti-sigma B factor antagonist
MAATRREWMSEAFPGQLGITISDQGTTTTVSLRGEWDLGEEAAIRRSLSGVLERSPERVILDLTGLGFIDSTGVHGVIELHQSSERQSVRLLIVPGSRAVQRVFELVGLSNVLPFLPARQAAEPRDPAAHPPGASGSGGSLSRLPTAPAVERSGGRRR